MILWNATASVCVQPLAAAYESQGQDKVNGGEGEGHEEGEKGQGRDVQCQLAMAEQELAAVKRHLAESRRENDDLLKAVAYLRSKQDSMAITAVDDTPTYLRTIDNNGPTTSIDTAAASAVGDDDDGANDDVGDDKYNEDDVVDQNHSSAALDSYNSKYYRMFLCCWTNCMLWKCL